MRSRAFRPTAAILSVLLLAGAPVQAGPVAISEVLQVIGNYQNPPELTLRSLSQTASTPIAEMNRSATMTSSVKQDSLLSGVAANGPDNQGSVEIIDYGEVEGTICDCGEITVPGGAFPKWPLLFLAVIPFFFIDHDCDDCNTPTANPNPTPTLTTPPTPTTPTTPTTPVPEPASLFLFGSSLVVFAAGLRRRHAKTKQASQVENGEEA